MSRRRRGFTMVEVLIVIGVMILLVGIGVIAYRGLDKMASERTTHVAFDNANAVVAEYEHVGQLATIRRDWFDATLRAGDATPIDARYQAATPNAWNVSIQGAYRFVAIRNGGRAIEALSRTARGSSLIAGLPSKMTINQPPPKPTPGAPAFADGWQNPIILAPTGGIKVTLDPGASSARDVVVTAPDHRAFWVSAGPDGDISKGDDNVYSFSK